MNLETFNNALPGDAVTLARPLLLMARGHDTANGSLYAPAGTVAVVSRAPHKRFPEAQLVIPNNTALQDEEGNQMRSWKDIPYFGLAKAEDLCGPLWALKPIAHFANLPLHVRADRFDVTRILCAPFGGHSIHTHLQINALEDAGWDVQMQASTAQGDIYSVTPVRYPATLSSYRAEEPHTPMMEQWQALRLSLPPDTLLAVRLGDFFEFFHTDAMTAAHFTGLRLTTRAGVPMAGFIAKNRDLWVPTLTRYGFTVACVEQTPHRVGGVITRKVTEVFSPTN